MAKQMYSSQRPPRNLDPVDLILLLLCLIILLNLGINVMILIWRSFLRSLHQIFDYCQLKGRILEKPQPSIKKPSGVQTLCIHCTLDPVAVNVAHSASNRHRYHCQLSRSGSGSYWGNRRSRRHRGRRRPLPYHHYPRASFPLPSSPTPATSPTSFCHHETWDTDLDDNKETCKQQPNYQQIWDQTSHPRSVRHFRGYWKNYYPGESNCSPQDLRTPKRVEAKSELRLETYYRPSPNCWPQNLKENTEPCPTPTSPQFTHRFPPNPSWMPGSLTPLPPGGQVFYDGWELRQRVRDGNKGANVPKSPQSVPRSSEPQTYADILTKQTVRRNTVPLISPHIPLNRTHVSAGHLPFSCRDRPEKKRWDGEHREPMPYQTSIGLSPTCSRPPNYETQNRCSSAPNENQTSEVSQPVYILARVPIRVPAPDPGRAPPFIPLSRSPGGLTNYQVYDSQELKRQIQEGRGRRGEAFPCSPTHPK